MLKGKNVLLAVTGSIAAYKSTYLVRELIKKGSNVKVIQTESSLQFVTPITLSTLSKNPVTKDFIKNEDTGEWNNHVALGEWADMMLIAPATAHTISNLVTGKADSFFLATFLSCSAPVFVAPAMDLDMFKNELYNFYAGKVEFDGPDPKRQLIVQTGIGGMQMINKAIASEAGGATGAGVSSAVYLITGFNKFV